MLAAILNTRLLTLARQRLGAFDLPCDPETVTVR
jgi:hypothetical protein